ncbi:MAG: hypothetical protein NTZ27_00685 [Ignavibacteriales bacterium]|nr:hypothetical protein [Ignavibacteriales bacterium]
MILAEIFSISTSINPWLILFLVLILSVFTFCVYKYTIPNVSTLLKTFLIILRSLIFILILIMIFEPVISVMLHSNVESKTLVFIDNSNSLAAKDSSKRLEQVNSLIKKISGSSEIRSQLFLFGKKVDSVQDAGSSKLNFREAQTNFSSVIDLIKKKGASVNSAVILSDGIINDGNDPTYQVEKLQLPIFTIGIGDSTEKKDILIYNVQYNSTIYAEKPTTIETAIKNIGFNGGNTRVSLYEENKLIETKDILLSETGLNKISFNYKPGSGGEKKLSISVSPLSGEVTTSNNSRVIFLNVLDTKLKVCLIAGSPSADVSAISKVITTDKNIQLKKIIQISANKFLNDVKISAIDSADVLFLIDFPASGSPQNLIDKTSSAVNNQNKPFFILLSNSVNIGRLKLLENVLPFTIENNNTEFIQVLPELNSDLYSSSFSTANNKKEIWNNLPPVSQAAVKIQIKPGSNTLVSSKVRNIPIANPLVVSRNLGKQRAFAILAGDIWKWQLQTAEKHPEFFDNFINDIVKWLNLSSLQKQFSVSTDKKIYSPNEEVNFTAQLYDNTFSPIDTAQIELQISKGEKKYDLALTPAGNGIYNAAFTPNEHGDYLFSASSFLNGTKMKTDIVRFSVSETQIEKIDTRMRPAFLKSLAKSTGGEYYSIDNYSNLLDKLLGINRNPVKETGTKKEYNLWSDERVLIVIIFLFAVEWFLRKRSGMI